MQRGGHVGPRDGHRARGILRRGGHRQAERLHRRASKPRVRRRAGRSGLTPRAPPDGEREELAARARARDALEQRGERLPRGAAACGVLVRAEPRDHGHEQKGSLRLHRLRREPSHHVPQAIHGAQPPGRVLILQVSGQRFEVLLQPPLAERVVQQKLDQRLRAQLADVLSVGPDHQRRNSLHAIVHLGK